MDYKDGRGGLVQEMLKCRDCSKSFFDFEELEKHIKEPFHECASIFHCRDCEETFSQRSERDRHEIVHKKAPLKYRCGHCNETFNSLGTLKSHERTHKRQEQGKETVNSSSTPSNTPSSATFNTRATSADGQNDSVSFKSLKSGLGGGGKGGERDVEVDGEVEDEENENVDDELIDDDIADDDIEILSDEDIEDEAFGGH